MPPPGHLVDQLGVDPVEEPDVEEKVPILVDKAAPEAGLDPGRGCVAVATNLAHRHAGAEAVAVDPERNRPPLRISRHRCEIPAGELPVEEARDVGLGKPQVFRREGFATVLEQRHGDVQPRGALSKRQRNVEIARRSREERVQRCDRIGIAQPVQFVQREHAGLPVPADGLDQQVDSVFCPAVGFTSLRSRVERFGEEIQRGHIGPLEGQGQIGG